MKQKLIIGGSLTYSIVFLIIGFLVYRSTPYQTFPPGSWEGISGVGIASAQDNQHIYISGKKLHCKQLENSAQSCKIEIAGKTLSVFVENEQEAGQCRVVFGNNEYPCQMGGRNIYVQQFVFIDQDIGLTDSDFNKLRLRFFFDSLPEKQYIIGIWMIPLMTGVFVSFMIYSWLKLKSVDLFKRITFSLPIGFLVIVATFFVYLKITNGLWD